MSASTVPSIAPPVIGTNTKSNRDRPQIPQITKTTEVEATEPLEEDLSDAPVVAHGRPFQSFSEGPAEEEIVVPQVDEDEKAKLERERAEALVRAQEEGKAKKIKKRASKDDEEDGV